MSSYFEDHNLDERRESRPGRATGSHPNLNPNLDDFMSQASNSHRPALGSLDAPLDRDSFLSFASFLSGVRARASAAGDADPVRMRLIEDMMSQLMQDAELRDERPPPASKFFMRNLPKGPKSSIGQTCPICVEEFTEQDFSRETPCKHLYHRECIVSWLKMHNTCPSCRSEFPTDDKEYEKKRKAKLGRFANDEDDDPASLMFG
ncbi:hypothetical protein HDU96_009764 [Phlyctochytrium bullatum]|nr:hypothetical protein HDU96_009764 [Phlyctochytrium bullatum]